MSDSKSTTKRELCRIISVKAGVTLPVAKEMVDCFIQVLREDVLRGRAYIDDFGSFHTKQKAARVCKDPRNGQEIKVPAKIGIRFKPSVALKAYVNPKKKK